MKHEVWFYDGSWHQPARTGHSDVWKDDTLAARIITAFLFCLSYWFCCFLGTGTDGKNLVGLRSYPDAVQAAVREHPMLGKAAPKEKSTLSILLGNLLLFTAVFSVLGFALKDVLSLRDFETAFWFFLVLGEGLGCLTLRSSTFSGGGIPNASASRSCRRNRAIKTRASTSALSSGASVWCRRCGAGCRDCDDAWMRRLRPPLARRRAYRFRRSWAWRASCSHASQHALELLLFYLVFQRGVDDVGEGADAFHDVLVSRAADASGYVGEEGSCVELG